jgi:photosystem II stability/assembly factor-like uncharacterized protein
MPTAVRPLALCVLLGVGMRPLSAQQYSQSLFAEMRWRMIGPHRGGRTVGAAGVPGQPNVFYIGVNDGGVWKTDDYGRTWMPIFDDQPTGSVGTVSIAPSDPNVVYVGSGEGLQRPDLSTGDGVYKSTDAGRTWTHMGLGDAQQIGSIIVDPHDPQRLFVAVLGHPYGPNTERGVFRSSDGGRTWEKVLYRDENTGAIALAFDPTNAQTIYAVLWAARQAPWENGAFQGPNSGLFKSTDGGATWRPLTAGLPSTAEDLGRIGFAIAPSDPRRLYAMVDAGPQTGVYRSDDAGESWRRVDTERRVSGRGSDFAEVKVDPKNPDIIYVANTSTYKSTDGGATFTAWKGAPGGDDYHTIWINPDNPQIILLAVDQGATITVNGGETWSSWYNQPTAQLYHVSTDNRFPYWVYGGQQESGSVGIASRSDDGEITFHDWHPVGVEEYGYVAPDPLDPNIIYGGKATRFNWVTRQTQQVGPDVLRSGKYRFLRTMPILFSPVDPHLLYLASNVLFRTTNGGHSWDVMSPDLTRTDSTVPTSVGVYSTSPDARAHHGGVIYAVAPSYRTVNTIWIGTDDGLIQMTRDGGLHWSNVTPPDLTPWAKVAQLDASHFDDNTVYAAINTFRLDDLRPHIYRTHDRGKTWTQITTGIPASEGVVNTVREDPQRQGLLYAGTERQVYVSFDDGDHWQSLRLNMPATSIRDLVIHHDDIVVGTHGRSFWILDDITPLRQMNAQTAAAVTLFKPQDAYRMRRDTWTDTPLPPEEPGGQNPPDGAVINYVLPGPSEGPITLEILDARDSVIRRYASDDKPDSIDPRRFNVPMYWSRAPKVLPSTPGMHRWIWDECYAPVDALHRDFPISAVVHDTPVEPRGPIVMPGVYSARLTVNGHRHVQSFTLKLDPRVTAPGAALLEQFDLAMAIARAMHTEMDVLRQVTALQTRIHGLHERVGAGVGADALATLAHDASELAGAAPAGEEEGPPARRGGPPTLASLNTQLATLFTVVEGADATPTTQALTAWRTLQQTLTGELDRWAHLKATIQSVNAQLKQSGLPPLDAP